MSKPFLSNFDDICEKYGATVRIEFNGIREMIVVYYFTPYNERTFVAFELSRTLWEWFKGTSHLECYIRDPERIETLKLLMRLHLEVMSGINRKMEK